MQFGMLAKDFKASADLQILPPPPRTPAPLRREAETEIRGCCGCCCGSKKGRLTLVVGSAGDVYTAGQSIPLTIKVCAGSLRAFGLDFGGMMPGV